MAWHVPAPIAIIGLVLATAGSAQPVPSAGDEFVVNSYTFGRQRRGHVSMASNGEFVVMWTDGGYGIDLDGQDGSDTGVRGQRFDVVGSKLGNEFQVNLTTNLQQDSSFVLHDFSGNFVGLWGDQFNNATNGRKFTQTGVPVGSEFEVFSFNAAPSGLAFHPDGGFVAVAGVTGRRFQPDGTPIGDQFQINTTVGGVQGRSAEVSGDASGSFVVVWESQRLPYAFYDIRARRFDSTGSPIGLDFVVNTNTFARERVPSVALDALGNFIVVWFSVQPNDGESDFSSIQGQQFASDGSPQNSQFQISTRMQVAEYNPEIAMNDDGSFMVVWESSGNSAADTDGGGIAGQQFDTDGSFIGGEFLINTYTTGPQYGPKVASSGAGRFIVVWNDGYGYFGPFVNGQDGSLNGVLGQRFAPPEVPIFADGFESQDTSGWSDSVP